VFNQGACYSNPSSDFQDITADADDGSRMSVSIYFHFLFWVWVSRLRIEVEFLIFLSLFGPRLFLVHVALSSERQI